MQTAITITHYYSVKITKPNGLTEALSKQVLEDILDHSKQKRSNKNYREGGSAVSRLLLFYNWYHALLNHPRNRGLPITLQKNALRSIELVRAIKG